MNSVINTSQIKGQLRSQGCGIDSYKQIGRVLLISIFNPTAELKQKAVEVMESFGGIHRRAFIVKMQYCWVIWR